MAYVTPATSLGARSASDETTAGAAAAAAHRVVRKLLSPNIVVVGCINEDTTVEVQRLPQPGETVLGKDVTTTYGGKGANQAVQAALLLPRMRAPSTESIAAAKTEEQFASRPEGEGEGEAGMAGATARKISVATEGAAQTAKAAGEGIVSAVGGLVSQLTGRGPTSPSAEEAHVVDEGTQLLLEKTPAGGKVALICKLGDDGAGARYRKYLAEKYVEQEGIFTAIKGKPTGRAFITVSPDEGGENTIAYVPGANEHLTVSDIQQPHCVRLLQQAAVVLCENGVDGSVTVEAMRLAKSAPEDVLTIFTPAPVQGAPKEAFAYADYIVMNAVEAQQLYEQLVPLTRVQDSAGNVFEEVQQEEDRREQEKAWPSLYATSAEGTSEAWEGKGRTQAGGTTPGPKGVVGTAGKLPSPLALRERLRAVGASAVEIHPSDRATQLLLQAAATAATPAGRAEASKAASGEVGPGKASAWQGPAAGVIEQTRAGTPGGGSSARAAAVLPPAAAADISEAAAAIEEEERGGKEGEGDVKQTSVLRGSDKRESDSCFAEVPPRRGQCEIIITAGADGCTVTNSTQVLHVLPKRVVQKHEVVDTVGAGDAFVGALAYFLGIEKRNIKDAVEKAAIVASYSIQRVGASVSYVDRNTLGENFFML